MTTDPSTKARLDARMLIARVIRGRADGRRAALEARPASQLKAPLKLMPAHRLHRPPAHRAGSGVGGKGEPRPVATRRQRRPADLAS